MTRIVREIAVARDAEVAWRLVGDLGHYDDVLVGITRWEPSGEGRYWVLMQVGSIATGGEVEVTVDPDERRVAWQSVRGTRHSATMEVLDDGPGACRIRLEVTFELVGLFGPLVTRAARPIVVRNLVASLETARHLIEHELDGEEDA